MQEFWSGQGYLSVVRLIDMTFNQTQLDTFITEVSRRVIKEMSSGKQYITEGWWGVNPLDGDGPMDMQGDIIKVTFDKIRDEFRKYTEHGQKWGALGNSIEFAKRLHGLYMMRDVADIKRECIETIKGIEEDEEYINSWKDPQEFKDALAKVKKEIEDGVFEKNSLDEGDKD